MAKILITDDSEFMRGMIAEIAEEDGHECFMAENGQMMLDLYDEVKPDIIFLDILMPGLGGLEALDRIRTRIPDAKIVICSSMAGQPFIVEEAIEKGAVDVLKKPFATSQIKDAIEKALA